METTKTKKSWVKKILAVVIVLLLLGGTMFWYIMNQKFDDTATAKPAYTVNAMDLIGEFQQNDSSANKKYSDQIVAVNGRISEVETADTTANIKFTDTLTGSYVIFDFQAQDAAVARNLKVGDSVSIKGSCSGSIYSQLRKVHMISFKRSVINK